MISQKGLMLVDSNLRERVITNGDCLGVIYSSTENNILPSFLLTSLNCDTTKSVVCEQQPSTTSHISTENPPKFPCVPQQSKNTRKKRDASVGSIDNKYQVYA